MTPQYLRPVFTLLFSTNISILTCVSILTLDLKNPPFGTITHKLLQP